MANVANFEEYKKNSLLNLSSVQNQENDKNSSSLTKQIDPVITFMGSKLWLDMQLDRSYYQLEKYHSTCLQFCYDTNLQQHIQKIKEDPERGYGMACLSNCLQKVRVADDLVIRAVRSHSFINSHFQEFSKIDIEVKNFNEQALKKNYSF